MNFIIHHKPITISTNLDAHNGKHGDVFTADQQTAGRGRLNHTWLSHAGENLLLSAVLDVANLPPTTVATFPLVVGITVATTCQKVLNANASIAIKWPNDVLFNGRKLSGILCERNSEQLIAGIGINVNQTNFPNEIIARATSLKLAYQELMKSPNEPFPFSITDIRDILLSNLNHTYQLWRKNGFQSLYAQYQSLDYLKGRTISVLQTDTDPQPITGICAGVQKDGSLLVGNTPVYAGEAHITAY